jgi:hypothetical protein
MEFLKKHYEKVLLGVVLVGLAVAVGFLPFKANSEKQKLLDMARSFDRAVKPLTNLDLAVPEEATKRLTTPVRLDLVTSNRLFNPMPWQRAADNRLIMLSERNIGPQAVTITKPLTPLYLTLTFESLTVSPDGTVLYTIGVENQAAIKPGDRGKRSTMCELNKKKDKDPFTLIAVKGKADDPAQVQLVLQMSDTGEQVTVAREKPFKRADAFMADLSYKPETLTWLNRRKFSQPPLRFNGEEYNILDVKQDEVVLSTKSNQKKWTIKYSPAP